MRGVALLAMLLATPGLADTPPALAVDLNRTVDTAEGCAATFVVANRGAVALEALALEAVLFDAAGRVERLTLFDLGAVPAGARRVREFVLAGVGCDGVSAILVNGLAACSPAGAEVCGQAPALSSRAAVVLE